MYHFSRQTFLVFDLCNSSLDWAWWHTPVILVLEKGRKEDREFEASLDFIKFQPKNPRKASKEANIAIYL